ncbi:hypothetical protein GOB57_08000 [Sinorhizobium meliloti]|nr:hypothetical protein [Sinorhizobium meliloti]
MSRNVLDADSNYSNHVGDTRLIPVGCYCYRVTEIVCGDNDMPRSRIQTCPFWGRRQIEDHAYGYCAHLKTGDWQDNGTLFLHDMVKECGINMGGADMGVEGTH